MDGRDVLAIEHDWLIRKLIRANLEPLGLEVQEAVSGQHGLQLLDRSQPDLIILDLDVPDSEALSLVDAVQAYAEDHQIGVVVLAGDPPSRLWRDTGPATGYLQKPFAAAFLLHQVLSLLKVMSCDHGQETEES